MYKYSENVPNKKIEQNLTHEVTYWICHRPSGFINKDKIMTVYSTVNFYVLFILVILRCDYFQVITFSFYRIFVLCTDKMCICLGNGVCKKYCQPSSLCRIQKNVESPTNICQLFNTNIWN